MKETFQVIGHKERVLNERVEILAGKKQKLELFCWFPIWQHLPDPEAYYKQFPKIINNKVQKFQRQMSIVYEYKGKQYTLKTPKMTEEWNATYNTDVGFPMP